MPTGLHTSRCAHRKRCPHRLCFQERGYCINLSCIFFVVVSSDTARMAFTVCSAEIFRILADRRSGRIENRHLARYGGKFPIVWRLSEPFFRSLPQCHHSNVIGTKDRSASFMDSTRRWLGLHSIQVNSIYNRFIIDMIFIRCHIYIRMSIEFLELHFNFHLIINEVLNSSIANFQPQLSIKSIHSGVERHLVKRISSFRFKQQFPTISVLDY